MRLIPSFFIALAMLVPGIALAHATPVEMAPASGAQLPVSPSEIKIRFSERLEPGSSRIRVTNERDERVGSENARVGADGYTLTVPVSVTEGIYIISWSVVSKDDGHFTRGSFAFSVGSKSAPVSSDTQIVQIASMREAVLMTVEFIGNSLLLGVLALLWLTRGEPRVRRILSLVAVAGGLFAIAGAYGQLVFKSSELAGLHGIPLRDAFSMYAMTAAGSSTIIRGAALAAAGLIAGISHFRMIRISAPLFALMILVFAYFRAIISHATANPFLPELSIAVNFIHVIEKDIWLGVLAGVIVIALSRHGQELLPALLPKVFRFLSVNLIVLTLSASYIIWLHLKDFSNITASAWGNNFVQLAASAVALIALHTFHVLGSRFRPELVRKLIAITIPAEATVALIVIFFSSVVIITSPPSHETVRAYAFTDAGTTIRLERSIYEDGTALITVTGGHSEPVVIIGSSDEGLQPKLTERFTGGYVFPSALLHNDPRVEIVVARDAGYDVHAVFDVESDDFSPEGHTGRSFDVFTGVIALIAIAGAAYAVVLIRIGSPDRFSPVPNRFLPGVILGGAIAALVVLNLAAFTGRSLANDFKAVCESDGNMWHIMQPIRAGVPISGVAREGCMLKSGQYHYPDVREYSFLRTLAPAQVTLDHGELIAGKSADLKVLLKEQNGEPALLAVEHERLLHMIIIAKDMRAFSHIHADDAGTLSPESVAASEFNLSHVFKEAGTYIIAVDYLHGLTHESRQFEVEVTGEPKQRDDIARYYSPATFDGYRVTFDQTRSFVGNDVTLRYTVTKDGEPVTDMEPYLAAAMHIAVVKVDRSAFVHGHGEVHPPGYVYTPPKNGVHVHAPPPAAFGPTVEAHIVLPEPGFYTAFGEFKHQGKVITTKFTFVVE